uniref:Putative secreted protein n=1 Tax=Anopheles marajoara TaxID=58244 RepID=A0A2M4CAD1_9DIPT
MPFTILRLLTAVVTSGSFFSTTFPQIVLAHAIFPPFFYNLYTFPTSCSNSPTLLLLSIRFCAFGFSLCSSSLPQCHCLTKLAIIASLSRR